MQNWLLMISIVLIVAILVLLQWQIFTAKKQANPERFLGRMWFRGAVVMSILLIWTSFYFGEVEVPSMVKVLAMLGLGGGLLLAEIFDRKFLYQKWRKLKRKRFLTKLEARLNRLIARKPESYREQDELLHLQTELIRFKEKEDLEELVSSKYFDLEGVRVEEFIDLAQSEVRSLEKNNS